MNFFCDNYDYSCINLTDDVGVSVKDTLMPKLVRVMSEDSENI